MRSSRWAARERRAQPSRAGFGDTTGHDHRESESLATLRYDVSALLQLGGGFLGAGFYYKTFMWPSWAHL